MPEISVEFFAFANVNNTIRLRESSGYGSTPMLNVKGDQITGILGGTTLNLRRTAP